MSLVRHEATAALIERSRTLCADLGAVGAESRALIDHGRARRLTAVYPRLRVIRGGSDAALLTEVLVDTRLCMSCIMAKTSLTGGQVDATLKAIAQIVRVSIGPHRCD